MASAHKQATRRNRQQLSYYSNVHALQQSLVNKRALQRFYILYYWREHGLGQTLNKFGISQRTLYRWRAKLRSNSDRISILTPKPTTPARKRAPFQWPPDVIDELLRIKQSDPSLSRRKVFLIMRDFCVLYGLPCPSESTIQRLLTRRVEEGDAAAEGAE